LLNFHLIN